MGHEFVEQRHVAPVHAPLQKDVESYDVGCAAVRKYAVADGNTLRAAVQDNIAALMENEFGYKKDTSLESVRLFLTALNVALAGFAYAFMLPFNETITELIAICVIYYTISMFILYSSWFLEGKCFLLVAPPAGSGKMRDGKMLRFTSRMDSIYEPKLQITLDVVSLNVWWRPHKKLLTVNHTWNATELFSKDGFVYPPGIRGHTLKLLSDAKWT